LRRLRSPRPRQRRLSRSPRHRPQLDHGNHPRRRRPGHPGLYVTGDPGGIDANAKVGNLGIRIGLGWAKSHAFVTGQCPVKRYNRDLMMAILYDKIQIAKAVNVTVISLDDAPKGYKDFDKGAAKKFVIDPHEMIAA